jgi:hypothetical protein
MPAPRSSAHSRLPTGRWLTTLLLAVLFSCIHGRMCFAADTYTVTQNQQLNFGILQKPSSGSQTWTISTTGSTSGTGTLLYGVPGNGDYTIKCTGTCTSTISISLGTFVACSGTFLSAGNINYNNGEYNGATPASGVSNPGTGGKDLKFGVTSTYNASVGAGNCPVTFSIIVNGVNSFPQTAALGFDVALALTKTADINFGTVSALNASTYKIATNNALITVSGTGIGLYGTTSAGSITIAGSATDGITISTGGYIANNGVTPSSATCGYNGGGASACDAGINVAAPGASALLRVGVRVTADGTQAAGTTAAPSFTVTVAYQ